MSSWRFNPDAPAAHRLIELIERFATSLEPALLNLVEGEELDRLRAEAQTEITAPGCWGTTFTLIQAWRRP
jgi:hypothetical protein